MTNQAMHERLLDLIQAEGIDTLFGIPDPSFFALFIEAERRGMEIVSPHHEQAAALTADGYFRMTGKPVVLCMNKGPGSATSPPAPTSSARRTSRPCSSWRSASASTNSASGAARCST